MNNKLNGYLVVFLSVVFLLACCAVSFADISENPDTETMIAEDENSDFVEIEAVEESEPVASPSVNKKEVTPAAKEIDSESGVYYTVKKGDTLWDLSRRFNNDSWKWPGVWSKNSQLTNPHLIYPGQRIKLFSRDDIEQVKKLEKKEIVEPEENEKVVESVETMAIEPTPEPITQDGVPVKLPFYHYSKISSIGFMTQKPYKSHGYIFKVNGVPKIMLSKGDEVYIKESKGISLTPGAKYFTYEIMSPGFIKNKLKENRLYGEKARKTKIGTQHMMTGVVEITGKKSGYALAKIIQSFRTIRLKNFVMPYTKRSQDITLAGSVEGLDGMIITGEDQQGMFGDNMIAFIDKGDSNGVKIGQMYNIYYPEEKDSAEFIGGDKLFIPVDFASFIVLHTEAETSTVLITSTYQGISAGDKWHYPQE